MGRAALNKGLQVPPPDEQFSPRSPWPEGRQAACGNQPPESPDAQPSPREGGCSGEVKVGDFVRFHCLKKKRAVLQIPYGEMKTRPYLWPPKGPVLPYGFVI